MFSRGCRLDIEECGSKHNSQKVITTCTCAESVYRAPSLSSVRAGTEAIDLSYGVVALAPYPIICSISHCIGHSDTISWPIVLIAGIFSRHIPLGQYLAYTQCISPCKQAKKLFTHYQAITQTYIKLPSLPLCLREGSQAQP